MKNTPNFRENSGFFVFVGCSRNPQGQSAASPTIRRAQKRSQPIEIDSIRREAVRPAPTATTEVLGKPKSLLKESGAITFWVVSRTLSRTALLFCLAVVGCSKNLYSPGNTGTFSGPEERFPPHPSGFSSFRPDLCGVSSGGPRSPKSTTAGLRKRDPGNGSQSFPSSGTRPQERSSVSIGRGSIPVRVSS